MAYILGFFAADGYITLNKRGANFWCIEIMDKNLLELIRKTIHSNHKISPRKGNRNVHTSYRLQIGSKEMCDDLRKLGFSENKTKSLSVPYIPIKYFADFIRGYFDGDGNVWMGLMHKKRKRSSYALTTVFTSCSYDFLESVYKKLLTLIGTEGSIRKGQGNFYRLTYSNNSSLKLYDFMYNRKILNNLVLLRKKRVFERFIKMRS